MSEIAWILVASVVFAGLIVFGGYQVERLECNQLSDTTGRAVQYRIPSGCYVEITDGRWIPADAWRDEGADQ